MASREMEMILYLLNNECVSFDHLQKKFDVSRRTLYYDLSKINEKLSGIGEIIRMEGHYKLVGDLTKIESKLLNSIGTGYNDYLKYESRRVKILEDIFAGKKLTIESLSKALLLSETTLIQTIKQLKAELFNQGVRLYFEQQYLISGDEIAIRDLYLQVHNGLSHDFTVDDEIDHFNQISHLKLTDYSKCSLNNFVRFVRRRIASGHCIHSKALYQDAAGLSYYKYMPILLTEDVPEEEKQYMTAYISTLSSLNESIDEETLMAFVERLILEIERKMMVILKDKEECTRNLSRHLLTSYNRIKYGFPIMNPLLSEIKIKYEYLFRMIKNLFKETASLSEFSGIRDEEVAFIVCYIGAYIERDKIEIFRRKRLLIVCPNGLTVTKTIQYQLEKYFPQVEIVKTLSFSSLEKCDPDTYDWIISTLPLQQERVIVVNPILKNADLSLISHQLFNESHQTKHVAIDSLVEVFKEYGHIHDEEGLKKRLLSLYFKTKLNKGGYPMLKELITKDKIQIIENVENWEAGIELAAKPLLEQGLIEPEYVEAMIAGINKYGPYIVLTDYFALAHSRPDDGVNELSMSLLKVNETVDLKGKAVNIIVVLAATDNKRHLKALSSLTELFMNSDNVNRIIQANSAECILELIEKYE